MTKATFAIYGLTVHLVYEVLPRQIVTWSLDSEKYQQVDENLVKLSEAFLRQHHTQEIVLFCLEHCFYQDMAAPSYPDYVPGEDDEFPDTAF